MTTIDVEGCHVQLVSHCLLPRPFCQHWKGLKFHIWVCCSEGLFLHHLLPVCLPIFPVINMIYELWLKHLKCTNWPNLTEAKMKKEKLWQLSTAAAVSVSLFHRSKYTNGDAKVRKTDTPSRSQWHESWSKALIEQHHISLQTPSKRFYRHWSRCCLGKIGSGKRCHCPRIIAIPLL